MRVTKRAFGRIRAVAVFVAVSLVLGVLIGCGNPKTTVTVSPTPGASHDPFVGTWYGASQTDVYLTITRHGDAYIANAAYENGLKLRVVFARHGDHLVSRALHPGSVGYAVAVFSPASKLLYFSPFGVNAKLTRVSYTAVPPPWSTASP